MTTTKPKCIIDPFVSYENYERLSRRIVEFKNKLDDPDSVPVKVFEPLPPKLVDQLLMLREMSKGLQLKKDEDIKNSQRTADEVEKPSTEEVSQEKSESVETENDDKKDDKLENKEH